MKRILLFFLLTMVCACASGPQKERESIMAEEKVLMSDSMPVPDSARAASLCARYVAFAEKYPQDSSSSEYLFRAADLSQGIGNFQYSLRCYDKLLAAYPLSPKAAAALFMRAFLLDQRMGSKDEAVKAYEAFLKAYPSHPLSTSAEVSLMQLQTGMTDEELIRSFEMRSDTSGKE